MSFLSATENVGFSGIPQNISDSSCATQYKMTVDGVSGHCSEAMYIPDSTTDEQQYIPHLNDNFYTKFKIDPNELYTFHDSDVIAGEITVSHTEDTFMFPDNVETKSKLLDSPSKELNVLGAFTNGKIKQESKKKVVSNGHYPHILKLPSHQKDKTSNTKASKPKSQGKEAKKDSAKIEIRKSSVSSTKAPKNGSLLIPSTKSSINRVTTNNIKTVPPNKKSANETFLDVFKREQGLCETVTNNIVTIKNEPRTFPPLVKTQTTPPKKSAGKTASQSKSRRGRGPAVHEALQRISAPNKAIPIPNRKWHAPGDGLYDCGPLDSIIPTFLQVDSSSDDEFMPDFESLNVGPVCVEESATETRESRIEVRRETLRRRMARAHTSLKLAKGRYREQRTLAATIRKQLHSSGSSGSLPTQTVNQLLAMRGMTSLFSAQERRKLRENGWSGGESGSSGPSATCAEEQCGRTPIPYGHYCLSHVTLMPEQRLYASCAAVFAGGARCKVPLLPLGERTPLCAEHAWKRDNYDKLAKDSKPRKVPRSRPRPPAPRRPKRRRRPPPRARPPAPFPPPPLAPPQTHSFSEMNVCSNSSFDSAEEATMGALSENEYISAANSHDLEVEVGHVPADDILDPAVLGQIPDVAFTEFFNQEEGETSFGESSELTAALEAVLDERGLDDRVIEVHTIDDSMDGSELQNVEHTMFLHSEPQVQKKIQAPATVPMEMSSSAPS